MHCKYLKFKPVFVGIATCAFASISLLGCAAHANKVAALEHSMAANATTNATALNSVAPLILQPKLLDADVAFKFAARLKDAKTIEVRYQIAPGYYAYKDKFKATVRAAGLVANPNTAALANLTAKPAAGAALRVTSLSALALTLPAGTMVDDPSFGRVETYRQVVFFDVPLSAAVPASGVQLQLNAQGCADVGVCYPPQRYSVTLLVAGDFVTPAEVKLSNFAR